MFKTIWQKILSIFNKTTQTTNNEFANNDKYAMQFESARDVNITAMFSNKLSNYVTDESVLAIEHDNKRAKLLDGVLQIMLKSKKKIVSRVFGTGGIVLVPFVKNGKLYYDKISQNRLSINRIVGDKIVDATILADTYVVNNALTATTYYRWADYKVEDSTILIKQRYTTDSGTKVEKPIFWSGINDEVIIPSVDRVLFSYIKSPVDNRMTSDLYGVPITYGCDKTIRKILETLDQIDKEFRNKEAFVGADSTLFDGDNSLPSSGVYKKIDGVEGDFWEIFDPAIRDSSYFNKLTNYFMLLEKEVGTSRGVLTDPLTTYQNVDEVKRALRDTLSIVTDMRELFIDGVNDFLYACDVLANYYNLGPSGDYVVKTTWGYGLIEDYATTFNQYNIGLSKGYVSEAEARNLLMDETMEESEKAIAEIKKSNPRPSQLLGIREE